MASSSWPEYLDVGAVRFARPTARYDDVFTFYRDDLGLQVLGQWLGHEGHDGYDGLLFGLPGTPVHMEITQHGSLSRIPESHPENQPVLYLRGTEAVDAAVRWLRQRGHEPVKAANPYWPERGAVVFADPDGWLVVPVPVPVPAPAPVRVA